MHARGLRLRRPFGWRHAGVGAALAGAAATPQGADCQPTQLVSPDLDEPPPHVDAKACPRGLPPESAVQRKAGLRSGAAAHLPPLALRDELGQGGGAIHRNHDALAGRDSPQDLI
jgi:hypothetical protein